MIHTAKCLFYIQLSELLGLGLDYTWLYYTYYTYPDSGDWVMVMVGDGWD